MSIIRQKLMIELTLCQWKPYLEHVLAWTVNIYLLGAWITFWTIFGRLFSKCFQARRTRILLEKSSHGFLSFTTWSIARKKLLCYKYVEITNARKLDERFQFSYPLLLLQLLNLICLNVIMDPFIVKWTKNNYSLRPGGTSKYRGRGAWTSHQVWRQNLGQGPAKFTK